MRTVEQFIAGLCAIGEQDFTLRRVAAYVGENRVNPDSLTPYLFYTPTHYTRNLIYKCDLYELLAICWEVGQISRIHNHQGQNCWMAVPIGRLAVQNYELVRADEKTRFCELRKADHLVMDSEHPSHVEPEMPIHAVLNLPQCRGLVPVSADPRRGAENVACPVPRRGAMDSPGPVVYPTGLRAGYRVPPP